MTLTEQLVQQLVPPLLTLIVTALGIVGTWSMNELRKKLKTERQRQIFDMFSESAREAVDGVMGELNSEIREAAADGSITWDEREKILEKAKAMTKIKLGEGLGGITEFIVSDDVEKFIRAKVDAAIERYLSQMPGRR